MATLTVPSTSRANREVAITGADFEADTAVRVSIDQGRVVAIITSDVSGDFDLATVAEWRPTKPGRYTVTADDGTNVVSADVAIYSTT